MNKETEIIVVSNSMSYTATADGIGNTFRSVSNNVTSYRSGNVSGMGFSNEQRFDALQ